MSIYVCKFVYMLVCMQLHKRYVCVHFYFIYDIGAIWLGLEEVSKRTVGIIASFYLCILNVLAGSTSNIRVSNELWVVIMLLSRIGLDGTWNLCNKWNILLPWLNISSSVSNNSWITTSFHSMRYSSTFLNETFEECRI